MINTAKQMRVVSGSILVSVLGDFLNNEYA